MLSIISSRELHLRGVALTQSQATLDDIHGSGCDVVHSIALTDDKRADNQTGQKYIFDE
jgi:hypothetical protein